MTSTPVTIKGVRVWTCDNGHFQVGQAARCHCGQPLHREIFVRPGTPTQKKFVAEWEAAYQRVHRHIP